MNTPRIGSILAALASAALLVITASAHDATRVSVASAGAQESRNNVTAGPTLARTGACPGLVNLTISNATPGGMVAIVYGPTGVFVKPNRPCQGLVLGVSSPRLIANWTADAAGVVSLNFSVPPRGCGTSVQAADVRTCVATNVIVL